MAQSINQKVYIWARGQKGKQVGRGECWDLAESALKKAKAMQSGDLGPVGSDDDYVWGDEVALKDVIAGDILQFRDFEVTITTDTVATFADESETTDSEEAQERPHHTAIVDAVLGGGRFQILEQNVKPLGKRVQRQLLYTQDVDPAETTVRKTLKAPSGGYLAATVVKTVTVTVSGTIWAYRPKARE